MCEAGHGTSEHLNPKEFDFNGETFVYGAGGLATFFSFFQSSTPNPNQSESANKRQYRCFYRSDVCSAERFFGRLEQ